MSVLGPDWEPVRNLWVVFVVTAASITDLRWGKVFNVLTMPALLAGVVINLAAAGLPGLWLSLQGIAMGLGLLLATLLLGQYMGGGDIKLLMALGAIKGPTFVLWTLIIGILLGGVLATGLAVLRGGFLASLKRLARSLYRRFVLAIPEEAAPTGVIRLPYALAIAGGALLALCRS